jgi:putative heme-binding domain-containing protein
LTRPLPIVLLFVLVAAAPARRSDDLTLPPGFDAEVLYRVRKQQGSWICMTADPRGRLIVSDQTGPLYRVAPGRDAATTKCEKLDVPLGQAHGLCWADDSLYVVVNGAMANGNRAGLYRVPASDGGEHFAAPQLLVEFKDRQGRPGAGEHGPHAVHINPADGKLYFIAGNATAVPDPRAPDSPARNWGEDILLPRITDHLDPDVMAPGGWLARCDADGKNVTLLCVGLRNAYDFGFTDEGEAVTFDSDMEWDVGTNWYRPTRITHLVSGGEYGWRNGSAKWPADYADSLPAVLDVGFASPTGVTFGRGLKFPARYQRAMFLADWAYGRIYAATLTPAGASYRATSEIFAAQRPFQLTAIVANPIDGALYAITGGRGTESQLYRFTYTGGESTAPPQSNDDAVAKASRELRRHLESFHGHCDPAAIDVAWPHLGDADPFIRFAARGAIEWQDRTQWRERALQETRPELAIPALIALARTNERAIQSQVLDALGRLKLGELPQARLIDALRAYELCFIRLGRPDAATRAELIRRLNRLYPSSAARVNRELCPILAYLDSPTVVEKTLALMQHSQPADALDGALALRTVKCGGWTLDQRRVYFEWLNAAAAGKITGGISLSLFLREIREDAIASLSESEKAALGPLLIEPKRDRATTSAPPPKLVRHWTAADLLPHAEQSLAGRSFAAGKAALESASCLRCHRFGEEGENVGPNLTVVGNRFSAADLLEAILLPSKIVPDQYAATDLILRDGRVINGQIEREDDTRLTVRENALRPETATILKRDVRLRRRSAVSPMPQGLLDALTRDQILDMIAYLRSAGNPQDQAFSPQPSSP